MEETVQVSFFRIVAGSIVVLAFAYQGYIQDLHQDALEELLEVATQNAEFDADALTKLWDLHHRILKLERRTMALSHEDERLMAHIRWFVMRRSGTNELRKMEAAIAKLEAD